GGAEAALLGRADERLHGRLHDVAQLIFRIDEVVAGVEVSVVLDGEGHAAVFAEDAEALRHSEPALESYIEDLDEGLADVAADPLVKDGAQKFAVLQRLDGPFGDFGGIFEAGADEMESVRAGGGGDAFDDGDELHVSAAGFTQELVDIERVIGIFAVDDGEGVEFDGVLFEAGDGGEDSVEGGLPAFVDAVDVVQLAGAVDGEADEEMIGGEELGPFVVEENAVGLENVGDGAAVGVFLLELEGAAEEVDAQERGFATLPGEGDSRGGLGLDVLADVGFQHLGRHGPVALAGVEVFLFEIEAIGTVEVTDWPGGLGHDMEGGKLHADTGSILFGGIASASGSAGPSASFAALTSVGMTSVGKSAGPSASFAALTSVGMTSVGK